MSNNISCFDVDHLKYDLNPQISYLKYTTKENNIGGEDDIIKDFNNKFRDLFSKESVDKDVVKHLRFICCELFNSKVNSNVFDLQIHIDGDLVENDKIEKYLYTPDITKLDDYDYISSISDGGTIQGKFGVCPTNSYKLQKFIRKGGFAIMILMVLFPIIYLLLLKPKKGDVNKK